MVHQEVVVRHVDVFHGHYKPTGVELVECKQQPKQRRHAKAKQKNDDFPPIE